MHRWRLPSFFLTNNTGEPHGDLLGGMKPFWTFSSRNSLSAVNSGGESEEIGPWNGFAPSSRLILRSYGRCGASALAFSPEKTLQNSWYSWGTLLRVSSGCAVDAAFASSRSGLVWKGLGVRWMLLGDSRNVSLPTSWQILPMVLLLTSQMSMDFCPGLAIFGGVFGLRKVIFVSTQSMLRLCWVSQS